MAIQNPTRPLIAPLHCHKSSGSKSYRSKYNNAYRQWYWCMQGVTKVSFLFVDCDLDTLSTSESKEAREGIDKQDGHLMLLRVEVPFNS